MIFEILLGLGLVVWTALLVGCAVLIYHEPWRLNRFSPHFAQDVVELVAVVVVWLLLMDHFFG